MKKIFFLIFPIAIFIVGFAPHSGHDDPFTSLRGGVYEDADGDGRCTAGQDGVANVPLFFTSGFRQITLATGQNGTYGLVDMGLGPWSVTVSPPPGWTVTSARSRMFDVTSSRSVITEINFCVQRSNGAAPPPTEVASAVEARVIAEAAVLAPPPPNDYSDEAAAVRAKISEMLLTDPEPAPIDEVAKMAAELPEEPALVGVPWLDYLNNFRRMGGLAPLPGVDNLSLGAQQHSRYMVVNDKPIAHSQNVTNPLYSPGGLQAAQNSDIFATTQLEATHQWAINFWISAPFHLLPIIDPGLNGVGYGQHNENSGRFRMSAVLDVLSDRDFPASGVTYPLMFPVDGSQTWVVRHSLYEWPDPLASCAGYSRPTGAPIVIQLGDGSVNPRLNRYSVTVGGQPIDACAFSENGYVNPDTYAQQTGRLILDERDAIVIMPRKPIGVGETVQVSVTADGQTYEWVFETVSAP